MGLFDAVKSFKNAITGGAAKVYVDAPGAKVGAPFEVVVRAQPQGCNVKYSRVYVKILGEESVEVPDYDFVLNHNGQSVTRREIVRRSSITVNQEVTVAPGGELPETQSGEWRAQVTLPHDAAPEFRGRFARHTYKIMAGMDCTGNDPDSGWQPLKVSA